MPVVRKVDASEVAGWGSATSGVKGVRKAVEAEYDGIVADLAVGDYAELTLDSEDKRLTVKNRVEAAIKRKGLGVRFIRTRGGNVRFQVVTEAENTPAAGESAAE